MPLYFLIVLIDLVCAVHVVRRGHPLYWIFIIFVFPVLGALVYLVAIVLPELQNTRTARQLKSRLKVLVKPNADLNKHQKSYEMTDTLENKINLAQALIAKNSADEAITLLLSGLQGLYEHDPQLLLLLARAYFIKGSGADAAVTLERIMRHNPDFRSQEGHLLYARSLELSGDTIKAEDEYQVLNQYYNGYEAKCRYALFLKNLGKPDAAADLFREIIHSARFAPHSALTLNAEWISIAREELK